MNTTTYPDQTTNALGSFVLTKRGPLHEAQRSCCRAPIDRDAPVYVGGEVHDLPCFSGLPPVTMHADCMDVALAEVA